MLITKDGFYTLNEEYQRWSDVYEDEGCDSREAFESLYELIGMILKDYSDVMEEQWCDEVNDGLLERQEMEDFAQDNEYDYEGAP